MAKVAVTDTHLTDIAEAIRDMTGSVSHYRPGDMPAAIRQIHTEVVLERLDVTENGIYVPGTGVDGYDEVRVSVAAEPTLQNKTVTQNGTYTADSGFDGLGTVTVNVSGGGGLTMLTQAEWDALSTAQKQAYGLVAIRQRTTGFEQGLLVNGSDYVPIGVYLPYSDASKIICEAYPDVYLSGQRVWGYGNSPMQITGVPTVQADGSVALLGSTSNVYGYVDLGASDTSFTAYLVAKTTAGTNYRRLLSAFNARSSGQGIMLYGATINISSWANDTNTNISSANDYFVGAIKYGGSGDTAGIVANASTQPVTVSKAPLAAGRYVTVGRTDTDPSGTNAEPSDINVKYFAVVSEAESNSVILDNVNNLISEFLS